jgi:hypothetical protein
LTDCFLTRWMFPSFILKEHSVMMLLTAQYRTILPFRIWFLTKGAVLNVNNRGGTNILPMRFESPVNHATETALQCLHGRSMGRGFWKDGLGGEP